MKVVVAGGTASIGRAIVDSLKSRQGFEYTIFSRTEHPDPKTIVVDYANIGDLTARLEAEEAYVVISALAIGDETSGQAQLNLIEAASRSKCTKRFLPSEFGIYYAPEKIKHVPSYRYKLKAIEALEKTDLEFSLVSNGFFLDYWASPRIPSHLLRTPAIWIDIANNFAAIPGDGNKPLVLTHSRDVGLFVAELINLPHWNRRYSIVGDRLTLNDAVRTIEEVKGVKFDVRYDASEKLHRGEATLTPQMAQMVGSEKTARRALEAVLSLSGINYDEGGMDLDLSITLNEEFPALKPLTVRDVAEAWKE
ncbi:hypothetical protein B0J12DRAFT_774030 [Macrophomina phaseolina]|uniref:NmrA-like domain-containing protein n=1 Tax=Macrophomina phaseolina TaxID=35725 RepID=A0ABQ8FS88_9PEZI|nr:hypothetical protein B0J12DRAFT_774030 [Macrophomina phaseolina]